MAYKPFHGACEERLLRGTLPSLGHLFRPVTDKAQVKASQTSVVEAHGTGTAVGDPVESATSNPPLGRYSMSGQSDEKAAARAEAVILIGFS
ncbi:hypothetical protein F5Y17DRAFT_461564 [Xylariaceae sp. FL0594]|nr:hypothetical protein F5Y17DRAFT_461564 [Xylariaceae sp. FL0594]